MAEVKQEAVDTSILKIEIKLDQKTGGLTVDSNTQNQILLLGMMSMATQAIAKPKVSPLIKPGALAGMFGKKA